MKTKIIGIVLVIGLISGAYYYHSTVQAQLDTLQSKTIGGKIQSNSVEARKLEKSITQLNEDILNLEERKTANKERLEQLYQENTILKSLGKIQ